jgi:hypothetical protein
MHVDPRSGLTIIYALRFKLDALERERCYPATTDEAAGTCAMDIMRISGVLAELERQYRQELALPDGTVI